MADYPSNVVPIRAPAALPLTGRADDLSFVKRGPARRGRPGGIASYWNVTGATGDYHSDIKLGEQLALEFLAWRQVDRYGLLGGIVGHMPAKRTGVEVGFLWVIDAAAAGNLDGARRWVAHCAAVEQRLIDEEAGWRRDAARKGWETRRSRAR